MPKPAVIHAALDRVADQASFLRVLLQETLEWPIEDKIKRIQDISYGWTQDDFRAQGLDKKLVGGQAWQIQPFRADQPWGIFVLEFHEPKGYRTHLRQVLRG
ncbi:MAG: hypothetical protein L0Y70_15690, partial [Gemmataceae bacterium]|nr:hypothetical protein [Gemmataceae bacterium]